MERWFVNDGPDGNCFGCGQGNEAGLKLRFRILRDGEVEAEYTAPAHLAGAPEVIHGGVQAVLLDEALGVAAHTAIADPALRIVTVDFRLRYRRPAHTLTPLRVRGRLERIEDRNLFLVGEILDAGGRALTTAEARWKRLDG